MENAKMRKCAYCGASCPQDPTSPTNGYCARCRERSHHDLEEKLRVAKAACKSALSFLGSTGLGGVGAAHQLLAAVKKIDGEE